MLGPGRLLCLLVGVLWAGVVRSDESKILFVSETTLPEGVDFPHAMAADADTMYLSSYGSNMGASKSASALAVRKIDMQVMGARAMGAGVNFVEKAMQDATYVYFATQTHPGMIVRLSKDGLVPSGNMSVPSGYTVVTMEQDNNYLYLMTFTAPSRILKVRKRDFLAVEASALELTLPPTDRWVITSTSDKFFLYVCTGERPATIIKVRKQDLKTMGSLTLASNENLVHAIQQDDFFLYAGTQEVPGNIIKINKMDMTRTATLALAAGEDLVSAATQNSEYLFVVANPTNGPGKVVKVKKSDMTRAASFDFAAGDLHPTAAVMSADGRFLFVSLATKPGKIVKLSASATVDCVLSPYSAWSTCTNLCGGGTQFRNRTVAVPPTLHGQVCAALSETRVCNPQPCPVACKVGAWGEVGPCDVVTGLKSTHRNVVVEPLHGGTACPALVRHETCIVDCKVADWGDWGDCNVRRGFRNKTRPVLVKNRNGGRPCPPQIEEIACNVACQVEPWKPWSNCDRDRGVRQRARRVQVMNKHHGVGCPVLTEYEDCVVHCEAGPWGQYGPCVTSGPRAGTSRRERPIIRSGRNGGKPCTLVEYARCATSCEVSAWTPWTTCDKLLGTRFRNRTITSMQQNGGDHCPKLADAVSCPVDCELSPWSAWQACDTLVAKQLRERIVEVAPLNGGKPCPELVQQRNCTVDCYVSEWTDFDECSAPCDGGTHSHYRVIEIHPAKGGAACPALSESVPCNTHACKPTDCEVSGWSEFTSCSKQCGTGTQLRSRSITVAAGKDGEPCPSLKDKRFCNTEPCVMDCSVGDWDDWQACDSATGKQKRTRPVLIQPQNGGALCPPLEETRDCDVDCVVSAWSEWSECNAGDAMKQRTRTVLTSARNGGEMCPMLQDFDDCGVGCPTSEWSAFSPCSSAGERTRTRTLTGPAPDGVTCVLEQAVACVVNCEVGAWMPWSGCSKADGEKKRERNVLVQPKHGGTACPPLVEKDPCVVNCEVSQFSAWSACDKAKGTEVRTRTVVHDAKNDGVECPALSESKSCVVDCELSQWGAFGECDDAVGVKVRTRNILVPPLNNGQLCGLLEESDDCGQQCQTKAWGSWTVCSKSGDNAGKMSRSRELIKAIPGRPCRLKEEAPCAVSCEVTAFGDWGPCDTANNVKIRVRTVTVPAMNGGSACPTLELRDTCVVDCKVGPLSEWTNCDKLSGKQSRTRTILMHPENGGKPCPPSKEEIVCKVDCLLSDYSDWGVCDKHSGLKTRARTVIYNSRNGGTPCGQLTDSTDCLVHCEASLWGSFTPCVQSGAKIGTMRRSRSVVITSKNAGLPCTLEEEEKCAVPCLLTPWGEWSECDFILGRKSRTRAIVSQPVNGGTPCASLTGSEKCGLPTPVPTPFVAAAPTPAPDPRELAIVPKTFDMTVQAVFVLSELTVAELAVGETPRAVFRSTIANQFGVDSSAVTLVVGTSSGSGTQITVILQAANPLIAHSYSVELEKVKADPKRLTEKLYQSLATEGFERAHLVTLSVVGPILVRGTIDAVSEHKITTKNAAGQRYEHQMTGTFTIRGYNVPEFTARVQTVFVFILAEHLHVEPLAVSVIGLSSGDDARSVKVDVMVKATKSEAADVAFRFQLAATDADKLSLEFVEGLNNRLMSSTGVAVTSKGGIETRAVTYELTNEEREKGLGNTGFQLDLRKAQEEAERKEGMNMYMLAGAALVTCMLLIGIAAIIVRTYKARQEKNSFFDRMDGEHDAENLLDDDDWANLGDWGDETFAGSNPLYGGDGGAGPDDVAANEL